VDDYLSIDPSFGTMADYEALLQECHARGIRVLMDLVLNHTSDTHPWFVAAADYLRTLPPDKEPVFEECPYVWYYTFSREPYEGFVPLEGTRWYYEARFWSEMPDLNLGNDVVRAEVADILKFWLDKGVDGFRLDAVTSYVTDSPEANAEFLRFLADTCRGINSDCYLVGEAWTDQRAIARLYSSGIDSLFDFPFAGPDGVIASVASGRRAASEYVRAMVDAERAYAASNSAFVSAPFYTNHDTARSASYYPSDDGRVTKMAYAMSLLMPGDSFVYYGEELGMEGSGKDENKRAPMYWSDDATAQGMCAAPDGMDAITMRFPSLEEQMTDEQSLWSWFKQVIAVRKAYPAIARGRTETVDGVSDGGVAAFVRKSDGEQTVLVVMNLRDQPAEKDLSVVSGELALADGLATDSSTVAYVDGLLSLPAYSIAVLTVAGA
jgi:glycosidase